jgi:hypothetical protein
MASASEQGYSDESQRAVEAFDSIPADSEAQVDYSTARRYVGEHVGPAVQNVLNTFEGKEYYDLFVDVTVGLPDGTTLNYREAVEKDSPDDYDLDEAATIATSAFAVMLARLEGRHTP